MRSYFRKTTTTAFILLACCATTLAQDTYSLNPRIRTVQALANGQWGLPPVIILRSGQHIRISFDDLQASRSRYTYSITHCNADWTESDLAQSEYMTGFNDTLIDDYSPAIGTEIDYCHYTFSLPNDDNHLLVSGNYRVSIFEDGDHEPVAVASFSVVEPHVGVGITITANTDIDSYETHQQVSFSVNHAGYEIVNPATEISAVVTQNRRWDTHAEGLQPSAMQLNKLIYDHQRKLIFKAGNEYRRFEMLDPYVPTMRVDRMEYVAPCYHATLYTDQQRVNYLYDQDQNGRYLIRNGSGDDSDTSSDYFLTHFALRMPPVARGDVYLFGDLTGNRIDPACKMDYNPIDHQYEIVVPLKQGSYNYMYLTHDSDDPSARTAPTEGDFHQTENEYWVFVYHRPFGERYDRLVGFATASSKE